MSFNDAEISEESGKPVSYYMFTLSETVWRFTNAENDHLKAGSLWKSMTISDDGVKQSGESVSDSLKIKVPIVCGPVQVHLTTPPSRAIQVSIFDGHRDETDLRQIYSGEISQVQVTSPGEAEIVCETTGATMKRDGLRLGWQRSCPYALYDPVTCRVDRDEWAVEMRLVNVQGYSVYTNLSSTFQDNHFTGGFIEWTHPIRGKEFRGIEKHIGSEFVIFGTVDDIYPGLRITAYAGCSRTTKTCLEKFDNLDNYGGADQMPGKSPFSGDPIF